VNVLMYTNSTSLHLRALSFDPFNTKFQSLELKRKFQILYRAHEILHGITMNFTRIPIIVGLTLILIVIITFIFVTVKMHSEYFLNSMTTFITGVAGTAVLEQIVIYSVKMKESSEEHVNSYLLATDKKINKEDRIFYKSCSILQVEIWDFERISNRGLFLKILAIILESVINLLLTV